jgi:hypothetical protein
LQVATAQVNRFNVEPILSKESLTLRNPKNRGSGVHCGLAYPDLGEKRRVVFLRNLSGVEIRQPKKKNEKI